MKIIPKLSTNILLISFTVFSKKHQFHVESSLVPYSFEPCHEIMVLFVLCKLILQAHMCSHPVGLDV